MLIDGITQYMSAYRPDVNKEPLSRGESKEGGLYSLGSLLPALYPNERDRPTERTWAKWRKQFEIPHYRMGGKCIFYDLDEVRGALARRCRVSR